MAESILSWPHASALGVVEGLTEYLPISSTGHLIITSHLLGLRDVATLSSSQIEAIQAFEIVIQGGAIVAVSLLYHQQLLETCLGILGKSSRGRQLFINLICATVPVLALGYLAKDFITTYLQHSGPVLAALVVGGIVMLAFEKRRKLSLKTDFESASIHDLSWKTALLIGFIQCFALWPGMSRSMVTIVAGMAVGVRRSSAAEFSFLAGLPVLLTATCYKAFKSGDVLLEHIGPLSLMVGLLTSTVSAILAMRWLISFLNRRGLELFGWYRLIFAFIAFLVIYS